MIRLAIREHLSSIESLTAGSSSCWQSSSGHITKSQRFCCHYISKQTLYSVDSNVRNPYSRYLDPPRASSQLGSLPFKKEVVMGWLKMTQGRLVLWACMSLSLLCFAQLEPSTAANLDN